MQSPVWASLWTTLHIIAGLLDFLTEMFKKLNLKTQNPAIIWRVVQRLAQTGPSTVSQIFGFFGFFGFSRWFCYAFLRPLWFFCFFWFSQWFCSLLREQTVYCSSAKYSRLSQLKQS